MALERDTNLVALAQVFPGVPYPEHDVRDRWLRLLADPEVTVEVVGPPDRLDVYLAYDEVRLRHLGVRPERWGEGLARAARRSGGRHPDALGARRQRAGPRLLRAARLAADRPRADRRVATPPDRAGVRPMSDRPPGAARDRRRALRPAAGGVHAGARRPGQGAEGRQGARGCGQEAQEAVGRGVGGQPLRAARGGPGRPADRRGRGIARGAGGHGRRRAAGVDQAAPPTDLGGHPAGAHDRPRRGAQGHPGGGRPGRVDAHRCAARPADAPRPSGAGF